MIPQDLHALDLRLSAGLVLVEEVAPQQHHVHLLLLSDAQELIKAVEAVHATTSHVTNYQDPEEVT